MSVRADFLTHLKALTRKEFRQIWRDPSVILLGILMPILLIILFGEGMSFDIQNIRLALAETTGEAQMREPVAAFRHNPTFKTLIVSSRGEAQELLKTGKVEASLVFEKTGAGNFSAQLLVDAIEAPRANAIANACTGVLAAQAKVQGVASRGIELTQRLWFNETANSRWFLVPGLFAIILTMTGTMLTALVIAREWERGTMEAILATPISPVALILAKLIPYFCLGLLGWLLCLFAALDWYALPVRGSLALITVSSCLYLVISLTIGLAISAKTRSQFLASQVAVLVSFIPALLLSGFIFDTRCLPAFVEALAYALPPIHYLELLKCGFFMEHMNGAAWRSLAVLSAYLVLLFIALRRLMQKQVRR